MMDTGEQIAWTGGADAAWWRSRRLWLVLAATLAASAMSVLPVPILGGLLLLFSAIPVLTVAAVLGPWWALVPAVPAAWFMAGIWGQWLSPVVFVAEVLWVGLRLRARPRASLPGLEVMFWLVVGTPVYLAYFIAAREATLGLATLVLVKQAANAVFNALAAQALAEGVRSVVVPTVALPLEVLLRRRLLQFLLAPLIAGWVLTTTLLRRDFTEHSFDELEVEVERLSVTLDVFLATHERTVRTTARVMGSLPSTDDADLQRVLSSVVRENRGFLTMLVAGPGGEVLAAVPEFTAQGVPVRQVLPSVEDRPYFREPQRTGEAFLSEIFRGRGFGSDLIVAVSAPFDRTGTGRPHVVEGSLDLATLGSILVPVQGLQLLVTDAVGTVAVSSDAQRHPPGTTVAVRSEDGRRREVLEPARALRTGSERLVVRHTSAYGWHVEVAEWSMTALSQLAVINTVLFLALASLGAAATRVAGRTSRTLADPLAQVAEALEELRWDEPGSGGRRIAETVGAVPREVQLLRRAFQRARVRVEEEAGTARQALQERDQALRELRATLANLDGLVRLRTEELRDAKERAESANAAKSAFLSNMSHELRTPINVVLGVVENLADGVYGPLDADQATAVQDIEHQARHLLALIGDVLDLARIESGRMPLTIEPVAVGALVDDAARRFAGLAAGRGIDFAVEGQAGGWAVEGDPLRLTQILTNLLGNAMKFTPSGGRVRLVVAPPAEGRAGALAVRDTGIGIPPDRQEAVFEPFEQAAGGLSRPYEGSGLGLAISRRLARAMGASLLLQSTPGEGAEFRLVFAPDASWEG